jgi:hypothetical protein
MSSVIKGLGIGSAVTDEGGDQRLEFNQNGIRFAAIHVLSTDVQFTKKKEKQNGTFR